MRALGLLAVFLLAGCVTPVHAPPAGSVAPPGPPLGVHAFQSACLGTGAPPKDATCITSITLPDVGLEEPNLAVDAARPVRLALVTNAQGLSPGLAAPPVLLHLEFFGSEDGGKTWARGALPAVAAPTIGGPTALSIVYDGSLGYAANGTLYLAGIASNNGGGGGCQPGAVTWPFETHSADNGKSWSAPHVLEQVVSDRTWLTALPDGSLFVDWYLPCEGSSHGARSVDGGASWDVQTLPCALMSPFAAGRVGARAGCGSSIIAWNGTGGPSKLAAEPIPGLAWRLGKTPAGDWALFTSDFRQGKLDLAWSDAAFSKWSAPIDLLAASPVAKNWQANRLFAAGVDGLGIAHAVMVGSPYSQQCDISNGLAYRETPGGCDVVHVAIGAGGAVLDARLLSSGEPGGRAAPPPQTAGFAAGATGDDYSGIAFAGNVTYIAWAREGTIDLTMLTPK